MNPIQVVILPEVHKFSLKVLSIPEEDVIKVFTTNCSDQSLNEGCCSDVYGSSLICSTAGIRKLARYC